MIKKILLPLLLLLAFSGQAAEFKSLQAHTFMDQWDKPQMLNQQTEWVIFSNHKAGGEWVKKALNELQIQDLAEKHWLYVADISAMPSLISRFVAIPKMQDYAFAIALEKDGETTANWPKKTDAVSIYKLKALQIEEIYTLDSEQAVMNFFKLIK
ncbi:MAG: hypothetical protein IE937_01770 [Gammaproteobacteria bacterium]|nr:hypothetical protein [Gammaproteobacteria bacterium]MBD3776633.1 hypothetical protein [Thiotrichales bacterium]